MEIIDIHTHIYPEKIAPAAVANVRDFYQIYGGHMDGTAQMLIDRGKAAGISKFVLLAVANRPGQVQSINNFIARQVQAHDCFLGLGALHARMEDIGTEADRIAALGLKGVKLHPDFQGFPIDDPGLYPLYEAVQGRLPVLLHMGDPRSDHSHPARLRRVLELFPRLDAIAAHFGGYTKWEEACRLLRDTGCVLDISSSLMFLPKADVQRYIGIYGAERIAFGTDYPIWDPVTEVDRFLELELTMEQKEQIAAKTARRILKL